MSAVRDHCSNKPLPSKTAFLDNFEEVTPNLKKTRDGYSIFRKVREPEFPLTKEHCPEAGRAQNKAPGANHLSNNSNKSALDKKKKEKVT